MTTISQRTDEHFIGFILRVGLIIPLAFLYAVKSDLPHVFFISCILVMIPLLMKKPMDYRDRPMVYSTVLLLILTAFPDLMVDMADARYGLIDAFARSNLAAPFLLYGAAILCLFRRTPISCGLIAGALTFAAMICGDIISTKNLINIRMTAGNFFLHNYQVSYFITIGVFVIFMIITISNDVAFFKSIAKREKEKKSRRVLLSGRFFLKALCLIMIPLMTAGLAKLYFANRENLKKLEFLFLRVHLNISQDGKIYSQRKIPLNYMRAPEMVRLKNKVLLWVNVASPPGYLRGNAYQVYDSGNWMGSREEPENLDAVHRTEMISYSTFFLPDKEEGYDNAEPSPNTRMHIYLDDVLTARPLPIPGNVEAIDIVAEKLGVTSGGAFLPTRWKSDGAYTAHVSTVEYFSAYQLPKLEMNEKLKRQHLRVPKELHAVLDELKEDIFKDKKIPENPLLIFDMVQKYMIENYTYSIDYKKTEPETEETVDPIIDFITVTKTGHCEFFASAAALVLRRMNIPTRYVTGFICDTHHSSGKYYYATGNNAHAWCEAYIEQAGKWHIVEPTPAIVFDEMRMVSKQTPFREWLNGIQYFLRGSFMLIRRGYFGEFMVTLIEFLFNILFRSPLVILVILTLAFFIWRRYKRWFKTLFRHWDSEDRNFLHLQDDMYKFELCLSKRLQIRRRAPSETLREWASEIEDREKRDIFLEFIDSYESIRFRHDVITDAETATFHRRSIQITKDLLK